MNTPAKFLVLTDAAPRATLFDSHQRLMGEVIEDDGFIVESLLLTAKLCPVPDAGMLSSLTPPPSPQFPVRCYELC
jgi:hypothetical protein